MEKFSTTKKLIHRIYGIKSIEAGLEILENFKIVWNIKIHKMAISINPNTGERKAKKKNHHNKLKTICPAHNIKPFLTGFEPPFLRQTRKAEIGMIKKSIDQIGSKSQPGGTKEGLFNFAYKTKTFVFVKSEPRDKTNKDRTRQIRSFKTSFTLSIFSPKTLHKTKTYQN